VLPKTLALFAVLFLVSVGDLGNAAEPVSTDEALADKIVGDPNAPVEVIAYESLTCPHCAAFQRETWPELKEKYVDTGKVKFIFRDFPLDAVGLHAAMMARCTGDERYFGVIDVLFNSQSEWARAKDPMKALAGIGRLAGLDEAAFDACMADEALMDGILKRRQEAQNEFDVSSTPTFIVNGTKVVGAQPFEKFDEIIAPLTE
jgi:protein-disulfide isomerase